MDVRSNEPASDGKVYSDPGIYTITATNPSTNQTTEKIIYVGNDPLLKAYAITGYTLEQIQDMLAQGATVSEDGTIVWPQTEAKEAAVETASQSTPAKEEKESLPLVPIIAVLAVIAVAAFVAARYMKQQAPDAYAADNQESSDEK